jgi:hypothetical protein
VLPCNPFNSLNCGKATKRGIFTTYSNAEQSLHIASAVHESFLVLAQQPAQIYAKINFAVLDCKKMATHYREIGDTPVWFNPVYSIPKSFGRLRVRVGAGCAAPTLTYHLGSLSFNTEVTSSPEGYCNPEVNL